jgi:hypothetical protein
LYVQLEILPATMILATVGCVAGRATLTLPAIAQLTTPSPAGSVNALAGDAPTSPNRLTAASVDKSSFRNT